MSSILRLCGSLLFLAVAAAQAVNLDFQASVDKREMAIDDDLNVTVQISGQNIQDNLPFPEFDPSQDFRLENKNNYQSSSQNISVVNGRMTRSVVKTWTFQFTFKPLKTGTLNLPGFHFEYQDFKRVLAPTPITVGKAPPESRDVDLILQFSKPSLYLNEQGLLTAQIRHKLNSSVSNINPPDIEKELKKYFWIKPMADKWAGKRENIGGEPCDVYSMNFIIFPIMDGKLKIPSLALQYAVQERRQRRSNDPFNDDFFGGFFDNVSTKSKTKYSSPITIDVKPLPEAGRPAAFTGAVGDFALSATLDKSEVKTGDAVNLKVVVSGRGNEKSLSSVDFRNKDKFEVFDPEIQSSVDIKNGQVATTKSFKYVLIPQVEGKQTVGPVVLYFFNPVKGRYDSALAMPALNVLKGKVSQTSQGRYLSKEEIRMVGKDIRYIKTEAKEIRNQARRLYRTPLFAFLAILPFLYTAAFLVFRRHTVRLKTDVEYARLKKARKQAAKLLIQAEKQIAETKGGEFYAALQRSLSGYIADKLNLPSAGLTNTDILERLKIRIPGNEALTQDVLKILEECDLHRFANIAGTVDERKAQYKKAEELITRLSKELK